jgi:hypothetical protein
MSWEQPRIAEKKSRWREVWPVLLISLGYMIPLFRLWSQTGVPDDLGVHITAHGKTGLLENWWYSYLLLQRHRLWDVGTFLCMWAAVVAVMGWIVRAIWQDRKTKQMGNAAKNLTKKGDAE